MSHPGATASDRHKVVIIGSGFGGLDRRQDPQARRRRHQDDRQDHPPPVPAAAVPGGDRHHLRGRDRAAHPDDPAQAEERAGAARRRHPHRPGEQTVESELLGHTYVTPYDSLIIAAGAGQSYFGNDHFAEWAPGMKSIDDALELRGRILGAFEQAERSSDPARREKLLTFVVVGAGPTGVEMAGQIAELADHTLKGAFRHIDSTKARVILLDAAPAVLPPMGEKLGKKAQARLEKMGVEIQLNAMVTDVDRNGITVKDSDGTIRRIESASKVWSAGVSASPLGKRPRRAVRRRDRPRRPGQGAARPVGSRPPERVRGRRHGRRRRRARHGPGRDPGRQVRREAHQDRAEGRRPRPSASRSSTSTRARWRRCRGSTRWPRSARWSSAASSPGWPGWCCTWSTWSASDQDRHAAVVDGDVPRPRARAAHHHRAAGLRPHPDRGTRGDRGVGAGDGEGGESSQLRSRWPCQVAGSRRRPASSTVPGRRHALSG